MTGKVGEIMNKKLKKKYLNEVDNQKGVTLIEVIISMALLGIISIIFTIMIATAANVQNMGNKLIIKSHAAVEQIENGTVYSTTAPDFEFKLNTGEEWTISNGNAIQGEEYITPSDDKTITYRLFKPIMPSISPEIH